MTAEANVMRMASSTMSDASMNTWLAASAGIQTDHGNAAPGYAVDQLQPDERAPPLPDVRLIARQRQEIAAGRDHEELDADDGRQPRRRPATTGAQNIEASEKMTASSGRVTRAESSLRAYIASSSYSNSGLMLDPCDRRARISRNCAWAMARGSLARGRLQ